MKLFQIEEPGGDIEPGDGPGAAVGIDIAPDGSGRVAIAVGGNAEILPGDDGARAVAAGGLSAVDLLQNLRGRAERQLARPVTHAVIAADATRHDALEVAAPEAGLTILRLVLRTADSEEASALAAAQLAEDLSPRA